MEKFDPDTQEWNTMVLRELQDRGVISVVLGDYHYGKLLEDRKLLTWLGPDPGHRGPHRGSV